MRALAEDFDIEVVLAISYSFDNDAGNLLDPLPVVRCVDIADLERKLSDAVSRCSENGRPFIVQEIGGYFAQTLAEWGSIPGLVGVVEDTRQGHWRYLKVNERLRVPVLSIAESPLKALEHHQIGRAIVYSVERQVRSHFFRSLAGEQVGIVGFGDIGSAAAHAMRGRNAIVSVYDVDPHKRASAWMQNFKVSTLEEIASTANIIIGCAGSQSIGADVLDNILDGALLVSGSSRQVEIDLTYLKSTFEEGERRGDLVQYVRDGQRLFLANDGKPINFLDGSAIGSTLDLVYTELYACTRQLADGITDTVGLHALDDKQRDRIVERWLDFYAVPESSVRYAFLNAGRR
ncbi:MAG: hypothetical protein LLG14_12125 [Nocardiaceae bacterium]|nr:hypothetical protein [Nocardiaceae bacterium]